MLLLSSLHTAVLGDGINYRHALCASVDRDDTALYTSRNMTPVIDGDLPRNCNEGTLDCHDCDGKCSSYCQMVNTRSSLIFVYKLSRLVRFICANTRLFYLRFWTENMHMRCPELHRGHEPHHHDWTTRPLQPV